MDRISQYYMHSVHVFFNMYSKMLTVQMSQLQYMYCMEHIDQTINILIKLIILQYLTLLVDP